jgi:hypothetical protein
MRFEIQELRQRLANLPAGVVEDLLEIERLLARCWHELDGGETGAMAGYKLLDRMKDVTWNPPELTFTIERHGATALGSTRAELHRWTVDVQKETATCMLVGRRQLKPMQPRLDVRPLPQGFCGLPNWGTFLEEFSRQVGG